MAGSEPYVMLLASLPHLPAPGTRKHIPITRLQLEKRLAWMDARDRERLEQMDAALHWARLPIDLDDEAVIRRAEHAMTGIESEFLRPIMLERLEMRSFTAALRLRARGRSLPRDRRWGLGRFVHQVERQFQDPAFGLAHLYPWLVEADRYLRADDPISLELLLMRESWRRLDRVADPHDFGFDAVALYVMRWDILQRYHRSQPEAGVARFDTLVEQALNQSSVSLEALA
ncbi:MAG: hypothetical protein ACOC00_01865 [Halothiobacillaceae bacterium]